MNVHLHNVITDITGLTGMQIVRDIASGVTDPNALASHRHSRCRASEEEIAAALTGTTAGSRSLCSDRTLSSTIAISARSAPAMARSNPCLQDLAAKHALPGTALPPARRRQRHKNARASKSAARSTNSPEWTSHKSTPSGPIPPCDSSPRSART